MICAFGIEKNHCYRQLCKKKLNKDESEFEYDANGERSIIYA